AGVGGQLRLPRRYALAPARTPSSARPDAISAPGNSPKTCQSTSRTRSRSGRGVIYGTTSNGEHMKRPYALTREDKKLIGDLLLELATELDLHYEDGEFYALKPAFIIIKNGVALLERVDFDPHPDVLQVLARFNKSHQ